MGAARLSVLVVEMRRERSAEIPLAAQACGLYPGAFRLDVPVSRHMGIALALIAVERAVVAAMSASRR
jgi:hypothetical protein